MDATYSSLGCWLELKHTCCALKYLVTFSHEDVSDVPQIMYEWHMKQRSHSAGLSIPCFASKLHAQFSSSHRAHLYFCFIHASAMLTHINCVSVAL